MPSKLPSKVWHQESALPLSPVLYPINATYLGLESRAQESAVLRKLEDLQIYCKSPLCSISLLASCIYTVIIFILNLYHCVFYFLKSCHVLTEINYLNCIPIGQRPSSVYLKSAVLIQQIFLLSLTNCVSNFYFLRLISK